MLDKNMCRRWDGSPALPYFKSSDLGIEEKRFSFKSGKNTLYGSKYFKKGVIYKDLVVFFHGLGAGRNAYMKEISEFVKHGYLVYAYDYTGCMESEGNNIIGLGQPLKDVECFFEYLDTDENAKGLNRFVVGHSWGGYVASYSIGNEKFRIKKAVSMAGFLKPEDQYYDLAPQLKKLKIFLRLYFKNGLKNYGNVDVKEIIKKTKTPFLYVQGIQDKTVPYKNNGKAIEELSRENKSIKTKIFERRGHNIHMSNEAENYCASLLNEGLNKPNNKPELTMDIQKATVEDPRVMKCIFDFLNS